MWQAVLYLFFGLLALWYGLTLLKQRRVVLRWPAALGRITERKVEQSPGGRAGKTSVSAFRFEALVKYEYQVAGIAYQGDKLYRIGWQTGSRKNREKFLKTLPDELPVRYNPANPADACLLAPPVWAILLGLIFGGVITLIAGTAILAKLIG